MLMVAMVTTLVGCNQTQPKSKMDIAEQLVWSEMRRVPNPINLDFQPSAKWGYSSSVELMGMMRVAQRNDDTSVIRYVYEWVDSMVTSDGVIKGYKPTTHNIDHLCPGKLLLRLYNHSGDERYMKAASSLMEQVLTHPRTSEGGLWHKAIYPHQMWLDGLYMGAPFMAEYGQLNNIDVTEDVVRQYLIVGKHTYDTQTGLYRHAWDEAKEQFWADSITGQSKHAWGRANGWFMMGMVDMLEFVPEGTSGRDSVVDMLQNMVESLKRYSDDKSGMWYQVLDSPTREGNYVESSCSAMFIYSMLKGVRMGYLPADVKEYAEDKLQKFIETFVKEDDKGLLSVSNCCAVAGLGGKENRSGTYEYYLSSS